MSLTAADKILTARSERRDAKRIQTRYHIDSLPEWLQVPKIMPDDPVRGMVAALHPRSSKRNVCVRMMTGFNYELLRRLCSLAAVCRRTQQISPTCKQI